ncbi:PepSY-associated TM helix domain-containing protein [Arenicella xantha]|uniref:Putative iron-regulated membrane protein n=1 Tax=Arenicella xantha TaxID=644221 RepID=A0A395JIP9_9GAMM|nr:PepSY-associated TM helix domain-containing protein [Arenicella xantha]RBP50656.1 putative iron-regulated membrane protein [Arenicella xantha]
MTFSNAFFSRSLAAHSWMGLFVGALMYLICLSGTLAVYFEEFERWEQPTAQEFFDFDIGMVDRAFNRLLASGDTEVTPHMYVTLPTQGNPRVGLITENEGWFMNQAGELTSSTAHPWTDVLTDLHLYLHLPKAWGMIVVSALGAMLLALVISGFASHRTLFKDAFKLRLFGNKQLEQTDIHNRLSVWGAPFHLMIGATGAFFGFSMVVVALYAAVYHNNDTDRVTQLVFGDEPELSQEIGRVELAKAFNQMPELAPNTKPILAIVHDTGTPGQFIEIYAQYPNRLIYSDNFVFDASGNFIKQEGFSDGAIGKQIIYSMYRLHFGHFGGWWTKVVYVLLGLALTVISVSGINIWLAKRRRKDLINYCWNGFVWGTPVALTIPAITRFAFDFTNFSLFWLSLVVSCVYACVTRNEAKSKRRLIVAWALLSVILVTTYIWRFEAYALQTLPLVINLTLICMPVTLFIAMTKLVQKQTLT